MNNDNALYVHSQPRSSSILIAHLPSRPVFARFYDTQSTIFPLTFSVTSGTHVGRRPDIDYVVRVHNGHGPIWLYECASDPIWPHLLRLYYYRAIQVRYLICLTDQLDFVGHWVDPAWPDSIILDGHIVGDYALRTSLTVCVGPGMGSIVLAPAPWTSHHVPIRMCPIPELIRYGSLT